jgi:2-C-methyl-D-erythritol 4-phosphate cytidylyltransferase
MVHDAARPCIESSDLNALVEAVSHSGKGAILGYPCRDSMKRASIEFPSEIACSVERAQLWHALTPQMFLLNELLPAYEWVRQQGVAVTDDAMVMEMRGHGVLVEGSELNIKITRPDDLILAKAILSAMDQRENVFVQ